MEIIYIGDKNLNKKAFGSKFAVLPMGSIEYHGHHSILGTDFILADHFNNYINNNFDCIVYPTIPYTSVPGKTLNYKGTIQINPDTMLNYLIDILNGIGNSGFDKILILNAHDGNMGISRSGAEYITGKMDLDILIVNWWQMATKEWTSQNTSFTGDPRGHGGAYEMSATWAATEERGGVFDIEKTKRIERTPVKLNTDLPYIQVESKPINWDGYIGNPNEINLEDGKKILREAEKNLSKLINIWLGGN